MKGKGIASTPAKAALAAEPYPAGKQSKPPMDEYQAKDDMMTLVAAHKIKSDKGRHAAAKAMAKKHLGHLKAITTGDGADGDAGAQD
jgi:hypothetical protein